MTHLFSSLFTCVLTLLRANHHYSCSGTLNLVT